MGTMKGASCVVFLNNEALCPERFFADYRHRVLSLQPDASYALFF